MRRLAAFFALPRRDRALLIGAFATLAIVRAALYLVTIERLRAWAGHIKQGNDPVDRVVWAVRTASRWMPGATCLCSALALQRMLSAQGRASELHIGVAHEPQGIAAHAWILHDGRVLIGEEGQDRYTILTTWRAGDPSNDTRARDLTPG
mgnify:CR=1 FL=1